jgi:hypothetical protein
MWSVQDEMRLNRLLTPEFITEIRINADSVNTWDFNTALGDNCVEKYQSLYIKLVELTYVIALKGSVDYFWMVAPPALATFMEIGSNAHQECVTYSPMGTHNIKFHGIVDNKWRLYCDPFMPPQQIIIGSGTEHKEPKHYGRLCVANFVI